MHPLPVVILQSDPGTARTLVARLSSHRPTQVANSVDDLRGRIAKYRVMTVVLDMEAASLSDLESLSREFPAVRIVCNHRLADDELWTATLNAGAADCCGSNDIESIRDAVVCGQPRKQAA